MMYNEFGKKGKLEEEVSGLKQHIKCLEESEECVEEDGDDGLDQYRKTLKDYESQLELIASNIKENREEIVEVLPKLAATQNDIQDCKSKLAHLRIGNVMHWDRKEIGKLDGCLSTLNFNEKIQRGKLLELIPTHGDWYEFNEIDKKVRFINNFGVEILSI